MSDAIPKEKACAKCGVIKPLDDFYKKKDHKDGRESACKRCSSAQDKAWYEANHEHVCTRQGEYRNSNRDHLNAYGRRYYEVNRDQIIADAKKYKSDRPERCRAHDAVRYAMSTGKLTRPEMCSKCAKPCKPDAHHWSYLPDHKLDVMWLCKACHKRLHAAEKRENDQKRKDLK